MINLVFRTTHNCIQMEERVVNVIREINMFIADLKVMGQIYTLKLCPDMVTSIT